MATGASFKELPRDASSEDNETASMRSKGKLAKLRLNDGEIDRDALISVHAKTILKKNNLKLASEGKVSSAHLDGTV